MKHGLVKSVDCTKMSVQYMYTKQDFFPVLLFSQNKICLKNSLRFSQFNNLMIMTHGKQMQHNSLYFTDLLNLSSVIHLYVMIYCH